MRQIILLVHNIRSNHNVGSLLRTADGLGINQVVFSGYTPYPAAENDERLPHMAKKVNDHIHKTALGAEKSVSWIKLDQPYSYIKDLKTRGFEIAALEQTPKAIDLRRYQAPAKVVLILGSEIAGVEEKLLKMSEVHLQIPMHGQKESFNVSVAAAMALYHLTS